MSTLTNIPINTRSMNGLITISDGAGTTIENGVVDTDSLITDTMESINMISDNMIVPRINTSLISSFGSTVNLTNLVQNLSFNNTSRFLNFIGDSANPILAFDFPNDNIALGGNIVNILPNNLYFTSGNTQFTNSTVSFPNSNVSFNSYLPTSTITTGFANNNFITKAYGDSVYHPLGSYASLPGNNAFTGTNTFNSNLPTSTISSATLGTQFITRAIADGRFGQLATANTWTSQNTFQNGILPCTTLSTTNIQLGGNNQLQYRQATSLNNISIGNNTLRGDSNPLGFANNTGSRNIGIGGENLINVDTGNDNIFIGYQAGSGTQPTRVISVNPSRCIAIGTYSQAGTNLYATDAISIGYNSLRNASGPAVGNICIGSNTGNAIQYDQYALIIGANACPSATGSNSLVCLGYQSLGGATYVNSTVAIGYRAGYSLNATGSTFVGSRAGEGYTTGNYNTCLGLNAGLSSTGTLIYTTCLGYNSTATSNNECVFGGSTIADQVFLTLPQKNRLYCNQVIGAVATYNITFRSNENVIVNSSLTTQINLPQATSATEVRLGATFNIIRTSGATSNIIISAFGTETIFYSGSASTSVPIDSWVNSISFVCVNNVAGSPMWAVCRYNDRVTLATDARKLQTLSDSSDVNYPICFTTISTGTNYNNVYADSDLTYNPSTNLLTVSNLTVGGNLTAGSLTATNSTITNKTGDTNTFNINFSQGTSGNLSICASTELKYTPSTKLLEVTNITTDDIIINQVYKPFETAFIGSNDTVLPSLPSLFGFYFWTDSNPSGTLDTIITLPQLQTYYDGCKITFRRMAYQGSPFVPRQLVIKTPTALFNGLNQLIVARDSATTIFSGTNYVLLTTAVSRLGAFASLVVRQNVWYVID